MFLVLPGAFLGENEAIYNANRGLAKGMDAATLGAAAARLSMFSSLLLHTLADYYYGNNSPGGKVGHKL